MRLILITYFFSVVAFGFAQEKDSLYTKGLEALSTKDYAAAEKVFVQKIETSPSFEGYYNLGYSFAKQKKWNESLWANEAALKYAPTNSKAIYNAKFSLKQISPEADWNHPYSWTERIILSIGETTWLILMILSSLIVSASIYFLLARKSGDLKIVWSKRLIIPFAVLLVVSLYCYNEVLDHYGSNRYAYSIGDKVNLYLSPEGLEVDENLPNSIRLNIVQDQEEWAQILTPDFRSFWVRKANLRVY